MHISHSFSFTSNASNASSPVQILRLIHSAAAASGGPIAGAWSIDHALALRGHRVVTVSLDATAASCTPPAESQLLTLGPGVGSFGYSRALERWLDRHLREYQAVLVEGLWQFPGLAARSACASANVPYFVFPHGMLDPWFKSQYPVKHFKKRVYWRFFEHRVLRDAAAVLFTCEEEQQLAALSFRPYQARGQVVGHGTLPPTRTPQALAEHFRSRHPEWGGKRLIVFLGRIHEKKGCDLLLEAFAQTATLDPDAHLVMAGPSDGGLAERLADKVRSSGLSDRVHWTGLLQGDDKWGALAAADLFVLPSHQENFGIAIAEALAMACPVLISDRVNIWREIQADAAGIVVPDRLEPLSEALGQWLRLPPEQRQAYSVRARSCFERRFHVQGVADRMLAIFEAAIAETAVGLGRRSSPGMPRALD